MVRSEKGVERRDGVLTSEVGLYEDFWPITVGKKRKKYRMHRAVLLIQLSITDAQSQAQTGFTK